MQVYKIPNSQDMKDSLETIRWMVLAFFIGVIILLMSVNLSLVSYRDKVHTIIVMVKYSRDMYKSL